MGQNISDKSFKEFLDGDEEALNHIIAAESAKLLANILRFVKVRFDAEEILQDIYLDTWNSRGQFATAKNMYRFMYSRARFKSLDLLKKRLPIPEADLTTLLNNASDFISTDVHSLYEAKELAIRLSLAVSQMPEQRRKVFMMAHYDGLKQREIADKLGISIKTVSVHMMKAIEEIKSLVGIFMVIIFLIKNSR